MIIIIIMSANGHALHNLRHGKRVDKDNQASLAASAAAQTRIATHKALQYFRKYLQSKDFINDFNELRKTNPAKAIEIALDRGIGRVQVAEPVQAQSVIINIGSDVFPTPAIDVTPDSD